MLPPLARKHYLGYATICLIWGSTWGAIRLLVRDVLPLRAAAVRFCLAALLLMGIALARAKRLKLNPGQWRALIILGFTMMALPFGLVFWAESRISSSMTALLASSCPLFVSLFTPLLTHTRVPRRAVFAMLIAMGGIGVLFYGGLSGSTDSFLGGGAVILAQILTGWSAVFAKRELTGVSPVWSTAVQFSISAAVLCVASLVFERGHPSDWNQTSILALGFLTIFGSVVAFSLYYWLLGAMPAYRLSTTNLVVPIVAMTEGAILLGEAVPLLMMVSAVLVLVSVAIVLRAEEEGVASLGLALVQQPGSSLATGKTAEENRENLR